MGVLQYTAGLQKQPTATWRAQRVPEAQDTPYQSAVPVFVQVPQHGGMGQGNLQQCQARLWGHREVIMEHST